MSLGKIAIGLIATGVTVVAVGGIVGGVVASRSAETSNPAGGTDGDNGGSNQGTGTEPGNTNVLDTKKLTELLNTVTVNNIRLIPVAPSTEKAVITNKKSLVETQTDSSLKIENVFAFNLNNYTLGLNGIEIPENTTIEISAKAESSTNLNDLNDGKLTLVLKAKSGTNETSRELNVETFKKPSQALKALVKTDNNTQYTLEVLSSLEKTPSFFTIEELNSEVKPTAVAPEGSADVTTQTQTIKESTLSDLYRKTLMQNQVMMLDKASLRIEGNVKLEKITKEGMDNNAKAYFYLTSADDSFLKLSGKGTEQNSETSEILVKQIKLNNLAVSSISVVPMGNDTETSNKFAESLKDKWNATDDNQESVAKAKTLTITVPMSGSNGVTVTANAYTISKKTSEDRMPVKANLLVSFGSGNTAKTYSTTEMEQLNELKNAGFGFGVYSKDLGHEIMNFKASNVNKSDNMLQNYFTAISNKMATTKPATITAANMKQDGMFYLYRLVKGGLEGTVDLGVNKPVMPAREVPIEEAQAGMNNNQNWVVFVNYSYPNLGEMKVLIPHSISLINVQIPPSDH